MFSRKIFIPFSESNNIGGPATFMSNLHKHLEQVGFAYAKTPFFAKGIFFPILYDLRAIKWIKFFGGKVIQRLDGVYYPSQHGDGYQVMNKDIEHIYRNYADVVIFQSAYSRRQCVEMMGESRGKWEIIHNGVDLDIFYPNQEKKELSKKVKFLMAGSFRKTAMIEPIVKALDSLKDEFDLMLTVAGPILDENLKHFFERDYIVMAGSLNAGQLSDLHRESDIFLHSQLNDNCPNAVLEAVSSGLPVVGFDGGSMSELLFFQKDLLAYVSEDIFQKYEDFDYRKLAEKIRLSIESYKEYRQKSLENCCLYDFQECGKKYLKVFSEM